MRIGNPKIKIGCILKLKITHGIYLGNTIVEKCFSGKAYLNVISTLDEEIEVQVSILCFKFISRTLLMVPIQITIMTEL